MPTASDASASSQQPAPETGLRAGSPLVAVLAVATGISVANLYYTQPLLDTLGRAFGLAGGGAGLIVTVTQIGYAAGLVLIVPLGDLLDRRRLVASVSLLTALSLAGAALAPGFALFEAASAAIGVTAVVAQVLVPFAAHLASDAERGRVVGRVMSGLLFGVLLARVASGFVSDALGWRAVFWIAAGLMLTQSVVLWRLLPRVRPTAQLAYPELLRSVWRLVREEPLLRRRAFFGMAVFGAFSVLWTGLPFLLARPPYGYGDSVIGLFGLFGVAGALTASVAGHLHDRGLTRVATGAFLTVGVGAFVLMGLLPHALPAIIAGVVLLDLGTQGTQVLNQSTIYQLRPEARSRLTTAYMTAFFVGGAVGSAVAAFAFSRFGWPGVAVGGVAFGGAGLAVWLAGALRSGRG
ncbi:MAG TPA: MFS transporter [Trueperaceae bacterium]|nr:MFS transporter [Trueperaceae bacterium]